MTSFLGGFREALNPSIPEFSSTRKANNAMFALLTGITGLHHWFPRGTSLCQGTSESIRGSLGSHVLTVVG